jgi:hypothetical protein
MDCIGHPQLHTVVCWIPCQRQVLRRLAPGDVRNNRSYLERRLRKGIELGAQLLYGDIGGVTDIKSILEPAPRRGGGGLLCVFR